MVQGADMARVDLVGMGLDMVVAQGLQALQHPVNLELGGHEGVEGLGIIGGAAGRRGGVSEGELRRSGAIRFAPSRSVIKKIPGNNIALIEARMDARSMIEREHSARSVCHIRPALRHTRPGGRKARGCIQPACCRLDFTLGRTICRSWKTTPERLFFSTPAALSVTSRYSTTHDMRVKAVCRSGSTI